MNKGIVLIAILLILLDSAVIIHISKENENMNSQLSPEKIPSKILPRGSGIVTNIWIDNESLYRLGRNNIKYLFVDVGDTGKDGRIKTPRNEIFEFLQLIDKYENNNNYKFILLPYSEIDTEVYDINSKEFQKNFIQDYRDLLDWGFDGILVDIEPVKPQDKQAYLDILDNLSYNFPNNSIISVYSGGIAEKSTDNPWEWDVNFYKTVSKKVDIISVPGYDTGIKSRMEYQNYLADQISLLSKSNLDSYLMFAVPSHKNEPETIKNALSVYYKQNKSDNFLGPVAFAEWTMDSNDWKMFSDLLLLIVANIFGI